MGTFYEFFAGGGMARAGLGEDWQCLFANDISHKKAAAYEANWGADHLFVGDVFDLKTAQLPGHADLAWGSFPCQDLSLAGNGLGLQGTRSSAFWGFWDIVRTLNAEGRKPKLIVLENVVGALTSHEGKDFEQIAKAIASEDYVFGAVVMDAVHFRPQSRPRLFIVAAARDMIIPAVAHAAQATPGWHPDALIRAHNRLSPKIRASWLWWNPPAPAQRQLTLENLIDLEPQGVQWHTQEETNYILSLMSEVNERKVREAQRLGVRTVGTIYRRTRNGKQKAEVRFDGVAGCLRTPSGGSSRQTIMVVNGESVRTRLISPREMARLMGLPEDYTLPARYNEAYHLLGDGVVVDVIAHLKEYILTPILLANEAEPLAEVIQLRRA